MLNNIAVNVTKVVIKLFQNAWRLVTQPMLSHFTSVNNKSVWCCKFPVVYVRLPSNYENRSPGSCDKWHSWAIFWTPCFAQLPVGVVSLLCKQSMMSSRCRRSTWLQQVGQWTSHGRHTCGSVRQWSGNRWRFSHVDYYVYASRSTALLQCLCLRSRKDWNTHVVRVPGWLWP